MGSYLTTENQVQKLTTLSKEENAPKSLQVAAKSADTNLKWNTNYFPAIERFIIRNSESDQINPADPSTESRPNSPESKPPGELNPPVQGETKPPATNPELLQSPAPTSSNSVLIMCLVYVGLVVLVVFMFFRS